MKNLNFNLSRFEKTRKLLMILCLLVVGIGQIWAYEYRIYCIPKAIWGNDWTEGSSKVKVWWKTNYGNTEFAQYMEKSSYTYEGNYIYTYVIYDLTGEGANYLEFQRFSSSDVYPDFGVAAPKINLG